MKTYNESPITTLQIIKPDFLKQYFEIRSGDELYGTLDSVENSCTLARIETHQGIFTVKRSGFFKPYVSLRKEKHDANEATAYLNLTGMTKITLENHDVYFRMINLWKNQWGWTNEKNQIMLRYKPMVTGTIKGDIEVSKDFFYLSSLETITMLGIYFLSQLENEIQQVNDSVLR